MAWKEKILNHLAEYKENILGIPGSGFYGDKEERHILPGGTWLANYLSDDALKQKYKRHTFWHHLNSSQTMCVNFFAPLFREEYRYLNMFLNNYLKLNDVRIVETQFENKIAAKKQSTNFDFYCRYDKSRKYYFEIKYTEKDISKSGGGENPEKTFNEIYRKQIEESSYLKKCLQDNNWIEFMFKHFQAYRNIAMANEKENRYVFFITMKDNKGTFNELESALKDMCEEHPNVISLYWEELVTDSITLFSEKDSKGKYITPEIVGILKDFQRKYLLKE